MSDMDYRLTAYAMDLLEASEAAELEARIKADRTLQHELEQIVAAIKLCERQATMQPDSSLRSRILDSINSTNPLSGFSERLTRFLDLDTQSVNQILSQAVNSEDPAWETSPMPGTTLLHFAGGASMAQADCGLVKLDPGARFPTHRHLGDEWAFVLQGEVLEDNGNRLLPGDISYCEAESEHGFIAAGTQPLILVVVLHEGLEILDQT